MRQPTFRGPLDNGMIQRYAPSVFASERDVSKTSERYAFVPTIQVVDAIRSQGFEVVSASQSRAKSETGRNFSMHMLRFRRTEHITKQILNAQDSVSELVLTNSHNGTTAFNLTLGLYRQVCSNGLIAMSSIASESIKHVGFNNDLILDAHHRVLSNETKLLESVEAMRSVSLNQEERLALAASALQLKYDETDTKPRAEQLLTVRRFGDQNPDLWSTFNVIQENMLRGGLRTISQDETTRRVRRNRTRAVAGVSENKRLNQALWSLAEEMRRLKVG